MKTQSRRMRIFGIIFIAIYSIACVPLAMYCAERGLWKYFGFFLFISLYLHVGWIFGVLSLKIEKLFKEIIDSESAKKAPDTTNNSN